MASSGCVLVLLCLLLGVLQAEADCDYYNGYQYCYYSHNRGEGTVGIIVGITVGSLVGLGMLISLIVLVCFLCKRKGPSGGHILYSSGNRIAIQPSTPQPGPACPPTQQQQQQQPVYVLSGQAVDYHPSPTTHQIPGQSSAYPQPPQPATTHEIPGQSSAYPQPPQPATTHEIPGQSSAYPQPSQPPTTTQIQQ